MERFTDPTKKRGQIISELKRLNLITSAKDLRKKKTYVLLTIIILVLFGTMWLSCIKCLMVLDVSLSLSNRAGTLQISLFCLFICVHSSPSLPLSLIFFLSSSIPFPISLYSLSFVLSLYLLPIIPLPIFFSHLPVFLSVYLSPCLSVCLSVSVSVYIAIYLSFSLCLCFSLLNSYYFLLFLTYTYF